MPKFYWTSIPCRRCGSPLKMEVTANHRAMFYGEENNVIAVKVYCPGTTCAIGDTVEIPFKIACESMIRL